MTSSIRECLPADHDAVVALSLRAWEPVFASVAEALGPELDTLMHGEDWRDHQAAEVRAVLEDDEHTAWVAEADGAVTGFVAAAVGPPERGIGEVVMLAVDPSAQRRGVGAGLTERAAAWLRAQGSRVVLIATGGDPGHAPARALYGSLGYRPFPVVQYYRAI